MPREHAFGHGWYRNASANADGEPAALDVGYCVFKPDQVRFLTDRERHAANEPFEVALANGRLLGPFETEEEAADGHKADARTRAGNAAFKKALNAGKPHEEAVDIANAAARAAVEAEKAPAPQTVESAPEPELTNVPASEPVVETKIEDTAPPAPAPASAPASSDIFGDDEPDTNPGVKPASLPAAKSSSKPVSGKKGK